MYITTANVFLDVRLERPLKVVVTRPMALLTAAIAGIGLWFRSIIVVLVV